MIIAKSSVLGDNFAADKRIPLISVTGSDAWKAYMRRQTSTINISGQTALAQGITFDL